jgi:hypothetical protein
LATYPRWKELGRYVRKGEKALTLCMPVTIKRKAEQTDGSEEADVFTRFVYRSNWFTLTQTEGQPLAEQSIPAWDRNEALAALSIEEIPFDGLDGNCLGYARDRSIAINPVNPLPLKTTFHELGHVLVGHTTEGNQTDSDQTPRNLRECEAEAGPALLCGPRLAGGGVLARIPPGMVGCWQSHPRTLGTDPQSSRSDSQSWHNGGSKARAAFPVRPRQGGRASRMPAC